MQQHTWVHPRAPVEDIRRPFAPGLALSVHGMGPNHALPRKVGQHQRAARLRVVRIDRLIKAQVRAKLRHPDIVGMTVARVKRWLTAQRHLPLQTGQCLAKNVVRFHLAGRLDGEPQPTRPAFLTLSRGQGSCRPGRCRTDMRQLSGLGQFLFDDLVAEINALVADVHAGAEDELLDLLLAFPAERAFEQVAAVADACHPATPSRRAAAAAWPPPRQPDPSEASSTGTSARSRTVPSAGSPAKPQRPGRATRSDPDASDHALSRQARDKRGTSAGPRAQANVFTQVIGRAAVTTVMICKTVGFV